MKKAISILLAVVIAISVIVPGLTGLDFADFATKAEAATSKASDAYATVFTASDFQDNNNGNQCEANLSAMINAAVADGCDVPDGFIYGGDYSGTYANEHDTPAAVKRMKGIVTDTLPNYDTRKITVVQGNHDIYDTSAIHKTGLHEYEDYLVYVLNCDAYSAGRGEAAKTKATALKKSLEETFDMLLSKGETRPIFIASHIPLHHNSRPNDSVAYAETYYSDLFFDTINGYSTFFDVIFLFGHNHSGAYDDYIGGSINYLAKGEKIRVPDSSKDPGETAYNEKVLNFTYMNYGYVGYSNNKNEKTLTMSAFEICPDRIEVSRYSVDGLYRSYEIDRRLKTNERTVVLAGYKEGEAGTQTGALALASGFTDPVYSWSSSNTNIAKIVANDRVAQVSYHSADDVTLTVTVSERNDHTKTATATHTMPISAMDSNTEMHSSIRFATTVVAQSIHWPETKTLEYYQTPVGTEIYFIGSYAGFATAPTVTWSSSDPSVASVDQYGKVTLNRSGTASITFTATDGTNTHASTVAIVFSTEKGMAKTEIVYEEVDNSTFSAGKDYVIVTTRTTNYVHKNQLDSSGTQGVTFYSSETAQISNTSPRTIEITDDSYIWSTVSTGTDGVYYLQNKATGEYLSTSPKSGDAARANFVLTTTKPTVAEGGWRIASNNNLWNGTYYWYTRGTGHTNLITSVKDNFVALFEEKVILPETTATITFKSEIVNGTTQTVYSVNDALQMPAYGDYTNIAQLGSVTWTSSDESVATVDGNGLISFKGIAGSTEITYKVTDAINTSVSCEASFTIEAKLGPEDKRTFVYAKTITPGKNYLILNEKQVGTANAISSYQTSNSALHTDRITVAINTSDEFYTEIPTSFDCLVWTPVSTDDGYYYLQNAADSTYLYAQSDAVADGYGGHKGTVFTSSSYATNTDQFKWTYTGSKLYNQSDFGTAGTETYIRIRSNEAPGISTSSSSYALYFYEEVDAVPNAIIYLRYTALGTTLQKTGICPDQKETFTPGAENFPDNSKVSYKWSVDNTDIATIEENTGVITYTGKAGVVTVTLTATSQVYDADNTKPVDTTTVKLYVNGGVETPDDPENPDTESNHYYLTDDFVAGEKFILRATQKDEGGSAISYAVSSTEASSTKLSGVTVTPQDGIIETTDSTIVWEVEASGTSGWFYLKNSANGQYLYISPTSPKDTVGTTSEKSDLALLQYYYKTNNSGVSTWVIRNKSGNLIRYSDGFYESSSGAAFELYKQGAAPEVPEEPDIPTGDIYYLTDSLEVGKKYVIANSNAAGAAKAVSNLIHKETWIKGDDVTIKTSSNGNYIANPGDNILIFEVVESGTAGYVKLKTEDGKYLVGSRNATSNRLANIAEEGVYSENCYLFTYSGSKLKIGDGTNNDFFIDNSDNGYRCYISGSGTELYLYAFDESSSSPEAPETPAVKALVQIRTVDYFGSVDITSIVQYRYEITNGSTEQLYRYTEDIKDGYTYTWSSSDTSIATVTSNGLVTYKGKDGNVTLSLRVQGTDDDGASIDRTVSTLFKVSTEAYKLSDNDYPSYPDQGAVRTSKTASNTAGGSSFQQSGVTEIELGVTGVPVEEPVDVLVVFDHSDSMGPEKMEKAIADTRNFALQLFNENDKNRFALVTFDQYRNHYSDITSTSMTVVDSGTEDKIITGDGTIQNAFVDSESIDAVANAINSLAINATGGTNYDSGLNYAYRILEYAKENGGNKNQVVIFMSDGAATKFNGLKLTDTNTAGSLGQAWLLGDESYFIENGYFDENGVPKDEYPAASLFNTDGDNWFAAAIKAPAGVEVPNMPEHSFYEYYHTGHHTGLGAKIYTIGYGVRTGSVEEHVLETIASDPSNFYSAASNLQTAYDSILNQILYSATNATVTDKMGDHFDVQFATAFKVGSQTVTLNPAPKFEVGYWTLDNVGNRVSYNVMETITFTTDDNGILTQARSSVLGLCYDVSSSTINGQYVSYNLNTETFTWNIGAISKTELTLKYYACLEGAATGEREAGTFETNDFATLTYTNFRGTQNCQKQFPVPTLAWEQAAISYDFYLVNTNGQPINLNGEAVPFAERVTIGREQTKKILLNSAGEVVYSLVAENELPEGYELYNSAASFKINVSSISGNSSATIYDETTTTYFRDGSYTENVNGPVTVVSSFTNTAVSFAVKASQGVIPDSIVIDYGLPVKINVLGNDYVADNGTITGVAKSLASGTELNNVGYTSSKLSNGDTADVNTIYGKATVVEDANVYGKYYIEYTPVTTNMPAEDVFYYEYKIDNTFYYAEVTVIPAANIYYEESFMTFIDGNGENYKWVDVGETLENKFQAEDRPGTFSFKDFDADNSYGEDPAYNDSYTYSLGSAKKTTVDNKAFGKEAKAVFTFTGTGFDFFSVTSNDTGAVVVGIKDSTGKTKNYIVNTYYGYKTETDDEGNTSILPDANTEKAMYQIPVVSKRDLTYGTYEVTIKPMYSSAFDPNYADGTGDYSIYVDSVRIFNPAGVGGNVSDVIGDAYLKDGEYAPAFKDLRDVLLEPDNFYSDKIAEFKDDEGNPLYSGSLYLDGNSSNIFDGTGVTAYKEQGPNNEVYLGKNQAVAFMVSSVDSEALASLQLGMKVVSGGETAQVVIMNSSEKYPNSFELSGSHETFKKLNSAIIWDHEKIHYEDMSQNEYATKHPIVIANVSDTVISLTTFKWAHTTLPESGTPASLNFMVGDNTPAMATMALRNAIAASENQNVEDKTYNEEDITMNWSDDSFVEGKEATLKVTTPPEVVKVTVGGIEIDKCEIDDNGNKLWTYTFVVQQAGENAYEVIFYDYNGDASEPVMTETIIVEEAPDEPTTDEPTTDEPTTDEPTTDEPTTDEPTTDEPTTGGSDTDEPTTEPSEGDSDTEESTTEPAEDDSAFDKVLDIMAQVFNKVFSFIKTVIEFFWRLF